MVKNLPIFLKNMADLSWVDLPRILIQQNPFVVEAASSYGLIVYARNTRKWFLVKRRHSHYLIMILRGCFTTANIPDFVTKMTDDEIQHLIRCLDDREYMERFVVETFQEDNPVWSVLVWGRLQESKQVFLDSLKLRDGRDGAYTDTDWCWVKGRQMSNPSKNYVEDGQDAAFREFTEESGIDLLAEAKNLTLSTKTFQFTFSGNSGRKYASVFWICLVDEEICPPAQFTDYLEVSGRSWFTTTEVFEKINENLHGFFHSIESHVEHKICTDESL